MQSQRRFHVALAVSDLQLSIRDYSERLGCEPCCVVENSYALWRTETLNVSISVKPGACALRHLGFEDSAANAFSISKDVNGIEWEHFSEQEQRAEIERLWPHAQFF